MTDFSAKDSTGTAQVLKLADITAAGTPSTTNLMTVQGTPSGTPIPVTISGGGGSTLPTNAATASAQATQQASLTSLDSKALAAQTIGTLGAQAYTVQLAGTLPLASGASTETTLAAINTKVATATGQAALQTSLDSLNSKATAINTNAVTVTSVTPPGTPVGGNQTVGTTPAAGPTLTLTSGAVYKADDDNTDSIYIGTTSSVSSTKTNAATMHRLKAGHSVYLPANNSNKYFFVGGAAAQTLYVLGA